VSGVWVGFDTPRPILPGSAYAGDVAVPMWANFMKGATTGHDAAWLTPPRDIVTATICRLSGKRPAAGCDHAQVVLEDGSTAERSMIATEYFARGTEPQDTCHLHVGRSLFARMGDWFRAAPSVSGERPEVAAAEPAPAPTKDAVRASAEVKAEPEPPKKRGFWSRIFGRGDKKDDEKKDAAKKPRG
jgi:penicillin-binding protein 1A